MIYHFIVRLALLDGPQFGQRHMAAMSGGHAILDLAQSEPRASADRRDEADELRAGATLPRHGVERGEVGSTTLASEESLSTSEAEEDASHLDAVAAFLLGLVLDRFEEAGAEVVGAAPGT